MSDNSQTARDGAGSVLRGARKGLDKSVAVATHRDYRHSLEAAMAQLVEVVAAHEAEIVALRRQIRTLIQSPSDRP